MNHEREEELLGQMAAETKKLLELQNLVWMTKLAFAMEAGELAFPDPESVMTFSNITNAIVTSYVAGDVFMFRLALRTAGLDRIAMKFGDAETQWKTVELDEAELTEFRNTIFNQLGFEVFEDFPEDTP